MSGFKPYPAYKDSGVEWLGEVPDGWTAGTLRWYATIQGGIAKGKDYDGRETITSPYLRVANVQDGFIDLTEVKEISVLESELERYSLRAGDVLMNEGGDNDKLGRGAVWQGQIEPCLHQNHVFAIRPNDLLKSEWLAAFTGSQPARTYFFLSSKQSTNLASISASNIMGLVVPIPSAAEQTQVLRFLDHQTARIDALIEEQQRLIELLKEKRQAVISHAVSKGLDPTVPMKDSGVEWLGEVPGHWKVSKLGHYARILTGFPFPSASFSHDESDVRLLRGANIGVGSLKWSDTVYWSLSEDDVLSSYLMEEGQIVLGMDRPWISEGIRIARVAREDMPCLLLQRVAAITPNAELDDEYLYCLLASELFKAYIEPDLTGVSVPHISPEQILSFQVPVPEIGEQRQVSGYISKQLDQMSALFKQASESVELLTERRSALISAAVTGKIDVRDWQPPAEESARANVQRAELATEA